MASRRDLKKSVNYIIGELFTDCIVNRPALSEDGVKKCDELLMEILKIQNEFLSRISHTEPGNVKSFYKNLHEDLYNQVEKIIEGISELK